MEWNTFQKYLLNILKQTKHMKNKKPLLSFCCDYYSEEVQASYGSYHRCLKCKEICNVYKPSGKELKEAALIELI